MAHNIDTMAWTGERPWHGLGVEVDNNLSVEEMLVAAGLDWTISKRPLYYPKPGVEGVMKRAHGQFALARDDNESILSIVGPNWKEIQNSEALDFFKKFVDAGHMTLETAGSLKGGKFIWGLAALGNNFTLASGDEMKGYMLLCSPHVFGYRFTIQMTAIRVVCWNTLSWSLKQGPQAGTEAFRMTHARAFDEGAKFEAEKMLGLANDRFAEFKEVSELLANKRVTYEEQTAYFKEVAQVEDDPDNDNEELPRIVKRFETALLEAPGAMIDTTKDTAWGLLNAVTYTVDHVMGRERDTAMFNAWMGPNAALKKRAYSLAIQLAA